MPNFNGLWTSRQQMQARGGNTWPAVPGAPTSPVATAGNASASVAFTAPADTGFPANAITGYRVTSSPGGFTGTGLTSPVTVTGLTNGTAYTFTVAAQNVSGYGPESVASNSVTPVLPNYIEEVFSTWLYTGNGGTGQTITNNINLAGKGGLVWAKGRSTAIDSHRLYDTVRGLPFRLQTPTTSAQTSDTTVATVSSFNSNGFTIPPNAYLNDLNQSYVSWTFREQPKFFDIVTYTGDGTTPRNINHNLGSVPGCIIIKNLTTAQSWPVYHRSLNITGGFAMMLNTTDATANNGALPQFFASTLATSTQFTVGNAGAVNNSGNTFVAYLFAHDAGGFGLTGADNVVSCGSFTTDGSGNATINLGYEPQFLIDKNSSSTGAWFVTDIMRGMSVTSFGYVQAQSSDPESAGVAQVFVPTSTGFQVVGFTAGVTHIYIAIRRGPMKVPTLGTSVYNAVARTGTGAAATVTGLGFTPDLIHFQARSGNNSGFSDKLRGTAAQLYSTLTNTEFTATNDVTAFGMNGVSIGTGATGQAINTNAISYINHFFQRAPGFFDEVCYTGTGGASQTFTHNLGVAPELVIVKCRNSATAWESLGTALSASQRQIYLNRNAAGVPVGVGHLGWNGTDGAYKAPTSSVVYFGGDSDVGGSTLTYVAYLFATCPGVSKVGTYTGTAATQTIACGFAAGAKFVLIKRTDSTGDWYVWDSVRGMVVGTDPSLLLNTTAAEVNANSVYAITTGFQIVSTAAGINASGGTYIFLAIA